MLASILRWLTGGVLDRVLDTVDRKITAETDREAIKGEIIKRHYETRSDWMRAGGFWLMLLFAVPLSGWFGLVIYDSALGCPDCLIANDWTVAGLPEPLDQYAHWIIVSIFGVIGVTRFK